jgi:prepilin-type N-terminal cleavage/methylation domain-containing protein
MQTKTQRSAFTLIELLLVIALIALLAALLFPVFGTLRGKARESTCLSNLHQIGIAITMYGQDYDELYPYALDPINKYTPQEFDDPEVAASIPYLPLLSEILQPYVRSREVFHCPSDVGFQITDFSQQPLDAKPSAFGKFGMSYSYMSYSYFAEVILSHRTQETLTSPAQFPLCSDLSGRWHGNTDQSEWRYVAVFADGHSKSMGFNAFGNLFALPL